MRNRLLIATLIGFAAMACGGCATMTRTGEENARMQRQIVNLEMRQIADDWNYVWLADRQPRLTKWHTR